MRVQDTRPAPRSRSRYKPLGVETVGGRKVVRVRNIFTGESFCVYERHGRIVHLSTDCPFKDDTTRRKVRRMLAS